MNWKLVLRSEGRDRFTQRQGCIECRAKFVGHYDEELHIQAYLRAGSPEFGAFQAMTPENPDLSWCGLALVPMETKP